MKTSFNMDKLRIQTTIPENITCSKTRHLKQIKARPEVAGSIAVSNTIIFQFPRCWWFGNVRENLPSQTITKIAELGPKITCNFTIGPKLHLVAPECSCRCILIDSCFFFLNEWCANRPPQANVSQPTKLRCCRRAQSTWPIRYHALWPQCCICSPRCHTQEPWYRNKNSLALRMAAVPVCSS